MRKIIASAGLVALGATGLQAAYAPGLSTMETSKPWTVSATLRGFYDDNYNTAPSGTNKLSSFGFEVRPSLGLNLSLGQTYVGLRYIYDMKYYVDRVDNKYDQSHQFDAVLSHTISERYSIDLSDSFVIAQEPELLAPSSGGFSSFVRTDGNNIRNQASAAFTAQLTTVLSLVLGYDNTLIDYEQTEADVIASGGTGASRSALLDRMEHLARINLRWQVLPETLGILGYQFGIVDYTSTESLDPVGDPTGALVPSSIRDSRSHYVYLGADHSFRPDLKASLRVGGQFVQYVNNSAADNAISPYADANLTYTYMTGSFLQLGLKHARNATDVGVSPGSTNVTLDQESTSVYAQLNHRITPSLTGNLLAQFQNSTFNGGVDDGKSDNFYLVGLNLSYRFNPFLSAEAGYNYDRLESDVSGRNYVRNRVYVGITASY
jgi:hypothetical protein